MNLPKPKNTSEPPSSIACKRSAAPPSPWGRDVLANLVSLTLSTIVTLFSLFCLFGDGVRIKNRLVVIIPLAHGAVDRLFTDIGESVLANVYGVSAVALTQGELSALIFYLLGLQSPALWVPAALLLDIGGSWGKVAILVGFGTGVIGLADNFIRHCVTSRRVNLHPLLVFFALLGGVEAFGFLGLFLGPATLSVAVAVFGLLRADAIPALVSGRTCL